MRETFELLGRQMTVLDLSGAAGTASSLSRDVPLRWSMGDGVVLDLRDRVARGPVTAQACQEQLDRIEYRLKPYDIVLAWLGQPAAVLGRPAVAWILEQGIRVIGVDVAPDEPESRTGPVPRSTRPARGGAHEYCRIDGLRNLHRLPGPHGFTVIAMPVLGRAAPRASRVVALYDGV